MFRYVLAALLLLTAVTAQDYVVYGPEDSFTSNDRQVTVIYERGSDEDFNEQASIYASRKRVAEGENATQAQKDAADDARNETLEALARAKSDDAVIIRIEGQSLILRYGECKSTDTDVVCFKAVTYLEEDTQPLGDTTLNSVKYENGELRLPLTISVEPFETKALLQRTVAKTTLYPGETTNVIILYRNTGNTDIVGARITEQPPLPSDGELTAFKGGLLPGDALTFTYTITAGNPGTYVLDGTVAPTTLTLAPTTITVKEPFTITSSTTRKDVNEPAPFTVTITNTYTETITVDDFTILTNDRFEKRTGVRNVRYEDKRITVDDTELEPGTNITINGSVTATAPGTGTLTITARITAARQEIVRETATYTIGPPIAEEPVPSTTEQEPPAPIETPQEPATPEQPPSETPTETQPAETPVAQEPIPEKDDRGILKRFLDWLDGFFS